MRRMRIPQRKPKPGFYAPFAAFEKQKPVSASFAAEVREKLETVQTRIFMGTGDDFDFSLIGTYLLYGFILAKNFEEVTEEEFRDAIVKLWTVKADLANGRDVDRGVLSEASREASIATEMVLKLTVGEQQKLREHVRRCGKTMLDTIQRDARESYLAEIASQKNVRPEELNVR